MLTVKLLPVNTARANFCEFAGANSDRKVGTRVGTSSLEKARLRYGINELREEVVALPGIFQSNCLIFPALPQEAARVKQSAKLGIEKGFP